MAIAPSRTATNRSILRSLLALVVLCSRGSGFLLVPQLKYGYPRGAVFVSPSDSQTQLLMTTTTSASSSIPPINTPTQAVFRDTNVLITGASGGLGRCLALALAQCQCRSLILSARKRSQLEAVATECRSLHPQCNVHVIPCDLSDAKDVERLGNRIMDINSSSSTNDGDASHTSAVLPTMIDVLINNGGVSSRSRFVDTDASVDQRVMQINFLAGAALAKAVVPGMIASGRSGKKIIWISSVQGLVGIPHRSSYAASKFAVQGYCESIRAELRGSDIGVHTISPGYINTGLSQAAVTGDGTAYGVTDATTAAGADPSALAVEILERVAAGQADCVVAATVSARLAVWLRLLCPGVLRSLLVRRYEKTMAGQDRGGGKKKDE